jgi:hypothetical protein
MGLSDLANQLYELREKKSELKAETNSVEKEIAVIEAEMLEEMAHEGLQRFDIKGTASFYIATRKFYKISDRESLIDFIHDQGDTDLLTVQHQTLNGYAKEMYARKEAEGDADFEMPGVSFTTKTQVRVRKSKN